MAFFIFIFNLFRKLQLYTLHLTEIYDRAKSKLTY